MVGCPLDATFGALVPRRVQQAPFVLCSPLPLKHPESISESWRMTMTVLKVPRVILSITNNLHNFTRKHTLTHQ